MEAWRQWLLGGRKKLVSKKRQRIRLTPTGLLMEGHLTQNPSRGILSANAMLRQPTCYASHMNPKQIAILVAALLFLVGSILPKPLIEKATGKPFENQWLARACLAAVGVVMMLALSAVP